MSPQAIGRTTFWLWMVRESGRDAAKAGQPLSANPHRNLVEREYWAQGHSWGRP